MEYINNVINGIKDISMQNIVDLLLAIRDNNNFQSNKYTYCICHSEAFQLEENPKRNKAKLAV